MSLASPRLIIWRLVLSLWLSVWAGQCVAADRLLIDDFSIDQQGFVTGSAAAGDLLLDPRLFGGGRVVWGGGSNNSPVCPTCMVAASVHSGNFEVSVGDILYGTGNVTWPSLDPMDTSKFDLSGYKFILLDVSDVTKAVNVRIIFKSASSDEEGIVGLQVSTTGLHSIKIPQNVDLRSVQRIFVGSLVERSERFALSSVWVAVPEPAASQILVGVTFLGLLPLRRWL